MSMKIPFVPSFQIQAVNGRPMFLVDPTDPARATVVPTPHKFLAVQGEFLLERANDPKLVKGMDPYPASRLKFFLRKSIREQMESGEAERNGYYLIKSEDEREETFTRLKDAILNPEGQLLFEPIKFNYFPFEESVCNATKSVDVEKSTNGMSASVQAS